MAELTLLRALLLLSLALGPLATRPFLAGSPRLHATAHAVAFTCAAIGLLSPWPWFTAIWLLFCGATVAQVLYTRRGAWFSPSVLAASVPFTFSIIAAIWLVGGTNDLRLLGYGPNFSFYAALHGNVLGWITLGALATLAVRDTPSRRLYLAAELVCLLSFLAIAFGIDQLRVLKPIGVVGLSLALPLALIVFLRDVRTHHRAAFALTGLALAALVGTMLLAWLNELSTVPAAFGVRGMVSVHGLVNAVIVAPCFLLAVALEARRGRSTSPSRA